MKLAISNIAWLAEEEGIVLPILKDYDVNGIEIAPTKYWHNLIEATPGDFLNKKKFLNAAGFEVPAAQALLYGHPELTIFADEESRNRTLNYLVQVGGLCSQMGIRVLVFGSPANRRRNTIVQGNGYGYRLSLLFCYSRENLSFRYENMHRTKSRGIWL